MVVTDSTASFAVAPDGVTAVPCLVVTPDGTMREGVDCTADDVAARLSAGQTLSTSQPPPDAFLAAYRQAADAGARAVVSVHISSGLSGTVASASHASKRAMLPVRVVDSMTSAGALGFAAQAAAQCAAAGCDADHVAARASHVAAASRVLFGVDSLDHLRRGGRLSAAAAALGAALGVRPILTVDEGRIHALTRVRSRAAVPARLLALTVEAAAPMVNPAIAVHYVGSRARAETVAALIAEACSVTPVVSALSPALAVHTGPDTLTIALADLGDHQH